MTLRCRLQSSAPGRVKHSSEREASLTLTGSCYMAQIRSCGSTSAAQALVGRSLAIGISQAVRDVSRVEVFSGSKIRGGKICDCGSEGCGLWVSGDWRAAKLESWREFCGGARGNAAYRYRMMYHEYHPATAFLLSRDLHRYSTRILLVRSSTVFQDFVPAGHVVGSIVHHVTTRTTSIAYFDVVITMWDPP